MARPSVSVTTVALEDILPNPYRRMERYAISEEKIDALLHSYDSSGFWDGSIQARPSPTQKGKYEIAFGHHRIEAAKRAGITRVGLVVGERTNAVMLKMMADENRTEFKHDALVTIETVRAAIEAFGRGEIAFESVHPESPKFGTFKAPPTGGAYTALTVARFLGWTKKRDSEPTQAFREAFDAYHAGPEVHAVIESLPPEHRSEVATKTIVTAARAAVGEARKRHATPAQTRAASRTAAVKAKEEVIAKTGFKAREEARAIGRVAARTIVPGKTKEPPMIEVYVRKLIARAEVEQPYEKIITEARRIMPYLDELEGGLAAELAQALEAMLERSSGMVTSLCKALRARTGRAEKVKAALASAEQAGRMRSLTA